jgi:hypothetical protein
MPKTTIDALDDTSRKLTARIERVANEGFAAAKEGTGALVKAYEAQYETGLELLKKSSDALKGLADGDLPGKARRLVDQSVTAARQSADTWIEFVQGSLRRVRRVLAAAIEHEKAA